MANQPTDVAQSDPSGRTHVATSEHKSSEDATLSDRIAVAEPSDDSKRTSITAREASTADTGRLPALTEGMKSTRLDDEGQSKEKAQ